VTGHHPIGIGLIGVGHHGIRYARHLLLQDVPGAVLRAACRQRPERGLDLPGSDSVRIYGDPRSLITDPTVDAVVVVTPPVLSRDICHQCIQARKPLLIEKPLSVSSEDARAMADASAQAGVPLMTAQTLRFDSTIRALKEQRGLIGHSRQLTLTSRLEMKDRGADHAEGYGKRGALLEFGVHMLDLVRFLIEEDVREVQCTMDRLPPTAPDTSAIVKLTTVGGTVCHIEVARVPAGRVGEAEWIGSNGRLSADWMRHRLRWTGTGVVEEWTLNPTQTVVATLDAFVQAITYNQPVPITGEDGWRAVELADACYRSAETGGRAVALPR
jgi:predicted dehydrogenase